MPFKRYNANWPDDYDDLAVEMACIQKGGNWKNKKDEDCGEGLIHHYEQMRRILWPEVDDHRWYKLCRDTVITNRMTCLVGASSSGKTFTPSWVFLCEYICFPEETCVLITSTTIEGLRMRVWGEINRLWSAAVMKFGRDRIPGYLVDSRLLIATQDINEKVEDAVLSRDWRQGIKGIACIQGNRYTGGLDRWVGIKQKRLRVIADECQYLPAQYLDAFVNLSSNVDFKAVILGNPKTKTDALGRASEPKDGWENYLNPDKTIVWDTKMFDGKCVNLVGTDSPNFDFPGPPYRYPYLMHAGKIKDILTTCAKDSETYLTFCIGTFKVSTLDRRVVTKEMCKKFKAQEDVTWDSMERTRVCALDAAYGGDRCIVGCADFARTRNDGMILSIVDYREIPVVARPDGMSAEDQISTFMLNYSHEFDIKPENFWHDATGRGSLGTSLARIWSALCNPLEFGGRPSKRPVTLDMMIDDPVDGMRRLKRCDEHYDRFVSELAFSVRYVIEGGQMRNLPTEIMDELVLRKWDLIRGDKISIEPKTGTPTKPGFKQLNGFSPDLADFCFDGETLVSTPSGEIAIKDLNPGDSVLTPFGETQIAFVRESYGTDIATVSFSDGRTLVGRFEHRIFTWGQGWTRLDSITSSHSVESICNLPIWKLLNSLFTRDESTPFKVQVDTIRTKTGTVLMRDFYTELSGLSITEVSLKVCASITKTVIGEIMTFPTSLWRTFQNTLRTICEIAGKTQLSGRCLLKILNESVHWQPNGTVLMRAGNGIVKMPNTFGSSKSNRNAHAQDVGLFLKSSLKQEQKITGALLNASMPTKERNSFAILGFVWCAIKNLLLTNTPLQKLAPLHVGLSSLAEPKKLYDLTLQSHNAYYANGILVENCGIICEAARQRGFEIKKLGTATEEEAEIDFFADEAKRWSSAIKSNLLEHA